MKAQRYMAHWAPGCMHHKQNLQSVRVIVTATRLGRVGWESSNMPNCHMGPQRAPPGNACILWRLAHDPWTPPPPSPTNVHVHNEQGRIAIRAHEGMRREGRPTSQRMAGQTTQCHRLALIYAQQVRRSCAQIGMRHGMSGETAPAPEALPTVWRSRLARGRKRST